MERSEHEWDDIIIKELCPFEQILQDTFLAYLKNTSTKAMDYWDMQNILNLIKTQQWERIGPYVENVNQTYLRELVLTLMDKAKKLLYQKVLMKQMESYMESIRHNSNKLERDEFVNFVHISLQNVLSRVRDKNR